MSAWVTSTLVGPSGPEMQLTVARGNPRSLLQGMLGRASGRRKCLERLALGKLYCCFCAGRGDIKIRVRRARCRTRPLKTLAILWMMARYDIREQMVHLVKTLT